jgi:LydA holin phage, holin superfamily III
LKFDELYESAGQVGLAFFGGLIGALMRREASSWQTALLGALGAGFVGLLVAKLCHATGVSDDLTFVFVGVAGWLGAARTIDYLERLIESRLGVRFPDVKESQAKPKETSDETKSYNAPDEQKTTMGEVEGTKDTQP